MKPFFPLKVYYSSYSPYYYWLYSCIPWVFHRNCPGKNDHVSFICNGCLNLSENVYAHAYKEIIDESDPSQDEYTLIKIPCSKEHVCVPCGAELSIK